MGRHTWALKPVIENKIGRIVHRSWWPAINRLTLSFYPGGSIRSEDLLVFKFMSLTIKHKYSKQNRF